MSCRVRPEVVEQRQVERWEVEQRAVEDRAAIHSIHAAAFGREDEANLVDSLRSEGAVLLSLVAEAPDGGVAGHVMFSRMWIDTAEGPVGAVALAPVAVLPAWQRRGHGARLIGAGLEMLRERGERIVIVLGDPEYYSRFGFSVERASGLKSPFPPESYLARELGEGPSEKVLGSVRYAGAFGLEGWELQMVHPA